MHTYFLYVCRESERERRKIIDHKYSATIVTHILWVIGKKHENGSLAGKS